MSHNLQTPFINSCLRTSGDAATVSQVLVGHYTQLSGEEKDQFVLGLVMELAARVALTDLRIGGASNA